MVIDGCELPYSCWELNVGFPQEQQELLTNELFSPAFYFKLYVCIHECGTHRGQKRTLDSLGLVVVNCPTWLLGTELGFSAREDRCSWLLSHLSSPRRCHFDESPVVHTEVSFCDTAAFESSRLIVSKPDKPTDQVGPG